MDPKEGIDGNGVGCWWVLWRREHYFWILMLFWGMMSPGRNTLFLGTWS